MNNNIYDYIIVGAGIAGISLHFYLTKLNKKVLIIDNNQYLSSSLTAAAMINPIVFKRQTKSWNVDKLLPEFNKFYIEIEQKLGGPYYFPKEIIRIFSNIEENNNWHSKIDDENFSEYISNNTNNVLNENNIDNKYSSGIVKNASHIDSNKLLFDYKNYLEQNNQYFNHIFDYSSLKSIQNHIEYKGFIAEKIIFCEGIKATENPYFSYLPFIKTKGEVLEIKCNELNTDFIINKGFFILPKNKNTFIVGATYNWKDDTYSNTVEAKEELSNKLESVIKYKYTIENHKNGIRPTVIDRRPIIGYSLENEKIMIFNGLGTKGFLIAPYYAKYFSQKIVNKNFEIDNDVNINRFKK